MSAPEDIRASFQQIRHLIDAGEMQQARSILGPLLRSAPNEAEGWYLASLLVDSKEQKTKLLRHALEIDPYHLEALDELYSSKSGAPYAPRTARASRRPEPGRANWAGSSFDMNRLLFTALIALLVLVVGIVAGGLIMSSMMRNSYDASLGILRQTETSVSGLGALIPTTETFGLTPSPSPVFTPKPTGTATPVATPTPTDLPIEGVITPLPFNVVDAEYSNTLDRIIVVSADPDQLHIFDPDTQTDVIVGLSKPPCCVSISPDGLHAAVGHDGRVSYVDLQQQTVVSELMLSAQAGDVVLAGNDWVYVIPAIDQWVDLHAIQISTNSEVLPKGQIYAGSTFRLASDGTRLYLAQYIVGPSLMPIDIGSDGQVTFQQGHFMDSGYGACGNVWPTSDGKILITACGDVFRADPDLSKDTIYDGRLQAEKGSGPSRVPDYTRINSVAVSLARSRILGTTDDQVDLWDYSSYNLIQKTSLPPFMVKGKTYASHGEFVFLKADSSQYYLILKTDIDIKSGLSHDFGFITGSF